MAPFAIAKKNKCGSYRQYYEIHGLQMNETKKQCCEKSNTRSPINRILKHKATFFGGGKGGGGGLIRTVKLDIL